jgi:hypothetical protein
VSVCGSVVAEKGKTEDREHREKKAKITLFEVVFYCLQRYNRRILCVFRYISSSSLFLRCLSLCCLCVLLVAGVALV